MNMVTAPAFADRLPAREPTIRELAQQAIAAHDHLNSEMLADAHWNEANARAIDLKDELQQRLFDATGLTPALFSQLGDRGLV